MWNWDGGELTSSEGNFCEVVWNEAGTKTISVTVGDVTDETSTLVLNPIAGLDIPEVALAGYAINIPLPPENIQAGYTLKCMYTSTLLVPTWKVNASP